MAAHKPEEIGQIFCAAFNSGDLNSIMALYEPEAKLVSQPGQVVSGHEAIRAALEGFLALKPKMNLEVKKLIQAEDVALLHSQWSLTGTGPDGGPITMSGQSTEVARQQPDGSWLYLIDNRR